MKCTFDVGRTGVRCRVPILGPGEASQITLQTTAIAAGGTGATAEATPGLLLGNGGPDPDTSNNSSHESTTVVP